MLLLSCRDIKKSFADIEVLRKIDYLLQSKAYLFNEFIEGNDHID